MTQAIAHLALVVKDYDEAIAFYTEKLGFVLLEDSYQPEQDKRWVVIAPVKHGANESQLVTHPQSLWLTRVVRRVVH